MSQKRILIVDDEPAIQMLYNEEFTEAGYLVESAYNGETGLAAFLANPPDLVILDINMPGLNGIEVLRRMKEARPETPIILNSAYQQFKQDLGAWASDAYIVKSYDTDELKDTVRRMLA